MKIWCFLNRDTAIKWRELLVAEQASPFGLCPLTAFFGGTPEFISRWIRVRSMIQFPDCNLLNKTGQEEDSDD